MKAEQKMIESINLSTSQILIVRLYRRMKQLEKRLADKIANSKAKILAFHSGAFVGLDGEKKVLSVSYQVKKSFNREAFTLAHPEIDLTEFEKESEPFLVIRLH